MLFCFVMCNEMNAFSPLLVSASIFFFVMWHLFLDSKQGSLWSLSPLTQFIEFLFRWVHTIGDLSTGNPVPPRMTLVEWSGVDEVLRQAYKTWQHVHPSTLGRDLAVSICCRTSIDTYIHMIRSYIHTWRVPQFMCMIRRFIFAGSH